MLVSCLVCKKGFHANPARVKHGTVKYCSVKCKGLSTAVFVHCKQCGKKFRVSPSKHKLGEGIYCSKKCSGLAHRNRVDRICKTCGKTFEASVSHIRYYKNGGTYCSPECQTLSFTTAERKEVMKKSARRGKDHPNWKGGITPERTAYWRSDEYQEWRTAVFERDNYTCQRCLERGGSLCAHHIIPYCVAPEERFEVSNGATLCKECHDYIHSKEMITVWNYNPSINRPSYEQLYECTLSNSGKAKSDGYANPEPSPLWEGVETRRQASLWDEGIVQTTNIMAAKAVDGTDSRLIYVGDG